MDDENQFSTEQLVELAKTNPHELIRTLIAIEQGVRINEDEYYDADDYNDDVCFLEEMMGREYTGIKLEEAHSEGGYEGAGEYTEMVVRVSYEDETLFFIRFQGCYYSYDGTTWDEISEAQIVEPREVTIIQYFAVDGSDEA